MPIAAVYASPMQRTHDTAAIVARPRDLPIVGDVDLREIDHDRCEQLRCDDVQERFPEEYRAWADPFTCAPPGGESGAQLLARALPAIRRIVAAHESQAVLVVSHKATIRLVMASLLGIDLRGYRDRRDQSLASLNILDFTSPTQTRLTPFNGVSHYAETFR